VTAFNPFKHSLKHVLKHPKDARAVLLVLLTLAMHGFAFSVPLSWGLALAWIPVSCFLTFTCCVIAHNHVHSGTFRSSRMDALYSVLLTVAKGHTSRRIRVSHNRIHHVHAGGEKDWIAVSLAGEGWGGARLARYVWNSSRQVGREMRALKRLSSRAGEPVAIDTVCLVALYGVMLAGMVFRPRAFAFLIALPWAIAMDFGLAQRLAA
jgi:fatty acid desaturase